MSGGRELLRKIIRQNSKIIVLSMVCAVLAAIAQALLPMQIQRLGDYLQQNMGGDLGLGDIVPFLRSAIALLAVFAFFFITQNLLVAKASGYIGSNLRVDLNDKLNRIPLSVTDKYMVGDIQSRFVKDVDTISSSILNTFAPAPANLIKLVLLLIVMFMTDPFMTIAVIVAEFAGLVLLAVVVQKTGPHIKDQMEALGSLTSFTEESISGHMVVKAFHCEEDMKKEFDQRNERVSTSSKKAQFLQGLLQPLLSFNSNLSYVAVVVTAAALFSMRSGSLTIGGMAAFILYAPMIAEPMNAVISFVSALQQALVSADRVAEVLNAPEMNEDVHKKTDDGQKVEKLSGDVEFEHVTFGYEPEQIVLHDLSAKVKAGQKVAIVGPTGAGKSTFVNLLMRFYEPQNGRILVDGIPVTELGQERLHDNIAMVLQDTWTFEGSIRDNIVYSTEGVTEERLNKIVEDCGLSYYVGTLPEGLDTVISERSDISAGQKQLLTIARALAKDSPILILDEATSNVDTRSELLIQRAIDRLTRDRTSFVIAHRLSTIQNADCIFVMKDGDVVEMGKHEELLEKNGLYSELYHSQFEPA
ncbi:MAG: ABC transporter ATP-binding protein [Lachnospiraceae bacterium]|nr:ABC transporter ATP-binding protein [Lachnospiraceae bacterium]MBR4174465.1 ABC transporter ATP-binding protein [Lachnospiraceae bacterium]